MSRQRLSGLLSQFMWRPLVIGKLPLNSSFKTQLKSGLTVEGCLVYNFLTGYWKEARSKSQEESEHMVLKQTARWRVLVQVHSRAQRLLSLESSLTWRACLQELNAYTGGWEDWVSAVTNAYVCCCQGRSRPSAVGTCLVVQWLRLWNPKARGPCSISGQRTRSHML